MTNDQQCDTCEGFDEAFAFMEELCLRFHLEKNSGKFDPKAFSDWVVVEAGMLFIRHILQPDSAQC